MKNSINFTIIGAGARGAGVYASLLSQYKQHNNDVNIIAVAEPNETRRNIFAQKHNIDKAYSFANYTQLLEKEKFADVVVIATQDADHFIPAKQAIEKGYHVLIEKPISNNLKECIALTQLAKQYPQQIIVVGHVLRYTPFFSTIKDIIGSHEIGDICSINHNENIGYYHFAHSFVRGNWRSKKQSSPLILAKSCHDMDIISWLVQQPCLNVMAYGSTKHFKQSQAPSGSAERCIECSIEQDCPYSAKKIYIEQYPSWQNFILDTPSNEENVYKNSQNKSLRTLCISL